MPTPNVTETLSQISNAFVTVAHGAGSFAPRNDIAAWTGGAADALDSLTTGASGTYKEGTLLILPLSPEGLKFAYLKAGTETEDVAAGIILPDDYNASTNAFHWIILG